ncbi:MAG: 16S rRNA (uracil(1498)-N(3))-methyltransferase [Mucilaginibacter polytrichastri]|nr:16S rRNA (uracil(1498)-N(3))-methyltransferase [Mucilaginibacter polytrichastri]
MHLFFTPEIGSDQEFFTLNEEESRHAAKVLRLRTGDTVQLMDGRGGWYTAEITDPHAKHTSLRISGYRSESAKRNHYLHIAVAPTKNIDRFEWFVEKATEIGIDEITPILCEHSERKDLRIDRIDRVIISAMKQSLKAQKPTINPLTPFADCVKNRGEKGLFIAHCADDDAKTALKTCVIPGDSTLVMIGPEGDFAPSEIHDALQARFKAVSLGDSRLRTETAALEACFEVNFLNR